MSRHTFIEAVADGKNGGASYQTSPSTERPFKVRGRADTPKTGRTVVIALAPDEARKVVEDWISFGLFGRHGRVETKP